MREPHVEKKGKRRTLGERFKLLGEQEEEEGIREKGFSVYVLKDQKE